MKDLIYIEKIFGVERWDEKRNWFEENKKPNNLIKFKKKSK